ncbi:MAG: HlyD family efflux transporter periplasmic adaptor subunit [Ekhidna sp.]|nr:HlyD family efflux transporter periplasmic adaptor subunit [Ekhidna sp.]MBC6409256.1 HlyD family efflux transporter periplasmic adaptor subunit [Ekhidna sp.]MBC6427059.1 HlyD family efflux transporter periplasmic adaptor subunit [Ekhidna sp.]
MRRKLIISGSAFGIIAMAFVLAGFFASQKEAPEINKPPIVKKTVLTRPIVYDKLNTEIVTYGRVETAQALDLLSEVSGRMFHGNIELKEGQSFKKGTLLFYIDDEEVKLNLKAQKSNFLRDLAGILPDLKVDFTENFVPWQEYFNALDIEKTFEELPKTKSDKEKIFLATQGIYSAYYSIKSAEVNSEKYRYYAPFNGSLIQVNLQSGSFVNEGSNIGKIIRKGVHELKVAVETKDIPWIIPHSEVEIYSEETRQSWIGNVARISDYVNQNTQSVDVFIAIRPNGKRIYDGQFFQASIPLETITNGMIMPRSAIYNGDEVFIVQDSLLKVKRVKVLRLTDENAIFNGLEEGSDLVVEPLIGAYNNMLVEKREQRDIDLELGESRENKKMEGETRSAKAGS